MEKQAPSICNVLKENTSTVIKKLESQLPTYIQIYSYIYKKYLHMVDDLFGTCYISEKEVFGKMVPDENNRKLVSIYTKNTTEIILNQIDICSYFLKSYSQTRITNMRNFDESAHKLIDFYSMILANWNAKIEK